VNLKLPESESDVRLRVYNGTGVPGVEKAAAADLRARRFDVVQALGEGSAPLGDNVVAIVAFGPPGAGAAWLVRAYLLNQATVQFEPGRQDADVDVILGPRFRQFATTTEMRQAIAIMGPPRAPC
jgi:hypothetical protein